jgi:predicted HTH transcriptional regulator
LQRAFPKILGATAAAGVLPPLFFDQALNFTAILRRSDRSPESVRPTGSKITNSQQRVLDALVNGPKTSGELATIVGVKPDFVRKSLRVLIDNGSVVRDGDPGQQTSYWRS